MTLYDDTQRWLFHEGYKYDYIDKGDSIFCLQLKHISGLGVPILIFEPKSQPNVLVIGGILVFSNRQNYRYLQLSKKEQQRIHTRFIDFCTSIRAITKFDDNKSGKKSVGVYIVMDKKEVIRQQSFFESLQNIITMSETAFGFLAKII